MANSWYDSGLEGFAAGNVDWDADNIKLVCIDETDDAVNLTVDDNLDDVLAGARIATSSNLGSKTTTDGYLDAADVTLTSVSGDQFESFSVYLDSGVESTSILLLNIDTATGLPLTPDGGNVTITWANGPPAGIARL